MPEGDTIFRTAAALRPFLVGRRLSTARTQPGPRTPRPPDLTRLIGAVVTDVRSRGKHLLISVDAGVTLRTHLGMSGSWHRYPAGSRWQRSEREASVVLGTPETVAVCFAPAEIELLATGAVARSTRLSALGPDLLGDGFDPAEARARLQARATAPIGEALLDQRALAGIGNVYRSEVLYVAGIHPWTPVAALTDQRLDAVVDTSRRLLRENTGGGRRSTLTGRERGLWTYGRAGRPCRRCGTLVESGRLGEHARWVYWCPRCQRVPPSAEPPSASAPPSPKRRSG